MDCKDVENKVLFYVNDELNDFDKQIVKNHLNECKNCSILMQKVKDSFSLFSQAKVENKDPYFYSRLKARMEQKEKFSSKLIFMTKPILQIATYVVFAFFAIAVGHIIANDFDSEYASNGTNELSDEELFADMNYLSMHSDDIYVIDTNDFEE